MKRLSNRNDATVQTGMASEAFINVQRRGLSAEMIMNKENNGGPAFPEPVMDFSQYRGMTLRDYFAAKFMQGICANPDKLYDDEPLAKEAYEMADAMLRAREVS